MAKSGLNAESPLLGLNVVSHHNVQAGSKNLMQELIFFKVWFYALGGGGGGGGGTKDSLIFGGALICLFGVCNLGLKLRGPNCAVSRYIYFFSVVVDFSSEKYRNVLSVV